MEPVTDLTEKYYELYRNNISRIEPASSPLLNKNREAAIERFRQLGIPSRKNEAYKYTDLSTFFRYDFESYLFPTGEEVRKASQFVCDVEDLDAESLIILNGYYADFGAGIHHFGNGVVAGSLNKAASDYKNLVEVHFGKYVRAENDGLVYLNSAMASDGLFIYVPDNNQASKPVQVINIVEADRDVFNQRRNLIVVGKNASFTLIVCDHTLAPGRYLTNTVTEIFVGENSKFDIIRIQNEHNSSFKITSTFIHQQEDSSVTSCNITLHGGLVRNNTHHYLAGTGAACESYGLYFTDKWQQVDNYVNVEHLAPECSSNQLFKGVLDDMATGAFNGRIFVSPVAQKTSAYQRNNTILLTADARMYTKPQLEIYADDVKCSHGATVGRMDDDAMFYLQSRGISSTEARLMLMAAFADEVIKNIRIEALRQRISNLIESRLRGELTRCTSCIIRCS